MTQSSLVCPLCGHVSQATNLGGLRMPPRKAGIVDSIKAAGDIGITTTELMGRHYPQGASPNTIKAHVWQINDRWLYDTPWRIVSEGRSGNARWHVRKLKAGMK